jgi:hypothetical protein
MGKATREVVIDGQHFIGGTMWFHFNPPNQLCEKHWPDFENIFRLSQWGLAPSRDPGDAGVLLPDPGNFAPQKNFWVEPAKDLA